MTQRQFIREFNKRYDTSVGRHYGMSIEWWSYFKHNMSNLGSIPPSLWAAFTEDEVQEGLNAAHEKEFK